MDLGSITGAIGGTTVTVETTLFPPMTVRVGELSGGEQSALTRLLRPRVTVANGNTVLYRAASAGDPDALPLGKIAIAAAALLALLYFAK